MPKAVVDPEELLRFAGALKRFNTQSQEELAALARHFRRLGETWQDDEQQQFAASFDTMVRALGRFLAESEQQVPVLQRKAAAIRDYQDA